MVPTSLSLASLVFLGPVPYILPQNCCFSWVPISDDSTIPTRALGLILETPPLTAHQSCGLTESPSSQVLPHFLMAPLWLPPWAPTPRLSSSYKFIFWQPEAYYITKKQMVPCSPLPETLHGSPGPSGLYSKSNVTILLHLSQTESHNNLLKFKA